MAHRAYVDPDTGFTTRVEHGRTAGLTVNPETGMYVCATPTSTPNADDMRAPTRSIGGVLVMGRGRSVRAVRTADMHDDRLPAIRRPKRAPRNARSNGDETTSVERVTDDMIRATILSVTGRAYVGPIDRRMRSMALDVIAHRESVGRYMVG